MLVMERIFGLDHSKTACAHVIFKFFVVRSFFVNGAFCDFVVWCVVVCCGVLCVMCVVCCVLCYVLCVMCVVCCVMCYVLCVVCFHK